MTDIPEELLKCQSLGDQPNSTYRVFDTVVRERVGLIYMTLFVVDGGQTLRVFSTDEKNYPINVRKPMADTPWGDRVLRGKKSYLGASKADIRQTFPDHALMESLGTGSSISVPVVFNDKTIGTINVNDAEGVYKQHHVERVEELAPLLVPAFLTSIRTL